MKVLLLAGGLGTRLSEETEVKPKPMVEIGGKPILWHIMKIYSFYGFNEFVILLGYKGYVIKEYFANYFLHQSDVSINLKYNSCEILNNSSEPWKITLIDTGLETMTGGRIERARQYVGNETFMLTYGDGVGNVNISHLMEFHQESGKVVTMTSVQPDGRFGALDIDASGAVTSFTEKPKGDGNWINAGFFVCEPEVFDYITDGPQTIFEQTPLRQLAADGKLASFQHKGFWRPMDTLRDKVQLNEMWTSNQAEWAVWNAQSV